MARDRIWTLDAAGLWRSPGVAAVAPRSSLVYGNYEPSAATTGVPDSVTLTTHAGDYVTTYDGENISALHITGQLDIRHSDVIVQSCKVSGGTPDPHPANFVGVKLFHSSAPTGIKLYDCTIKASVTNVDATAGIQGYGYEAHRCNISGWVDGCVAQDGDVGIYGCYIHDLNWYATDPRQVDDGSHNDGIQIAGNGNNFVFRGNSLNMSTDHTSCILLKQDTGAITGAIIDKNYIRSDAVDGCATGINVAEGAYSGMTNVEITDNRFSDLDQWDSNHAALVDADTYDAATITGNVYDTDGVTAAKITRVG